MRRLFICAFLMTAASYTGMCSHPEDSIVIVFWNLENFFDHIDQGKGDSDREFSFSGARHWTRSRFYSKCDAIAKSLLWMKDRYGRIPDIIGVAEVENKEVLHKLVNHTLLRKFGYGMVHQDSHDKRGIDVAMLYRKASFRLLSSSFIQPECNGKKMDTRDILHAHLVFCNGSRFNIMVNHHPSRYGGSVKSEERRDASMNSLKEICDSAILSDDSSSLVVMGDFNDTPDAERFHVLDGILVNKAMPLLQRHEGTIRFRGKWELIDMFLVSSFLDRHSYMEIVKIPFLMTYDRTFPGEKPLRTYTGPVYTGGVSDHCPIVLVLKN